MKEFSAYISKSSSKDHSLLFELKTKNEDLQKIIQIKKHELTELLQEIEVLKNQMSSSEPNTLHSEAELQAILLEKQEIILNQEATLASLN